MLASLKASSSEGILTDPVITRSNASPLPGREETCTGLEFSAWMGLWWGFLQTVPSPLFSEHSFIRKQFAVVWPSPFFRQEKHAFCSWIYNFPPFIRRHRLEPGTLVGIMTRLTQVAVARTLVSVDILRSWMFPPVPRASSEERRLYPSILANFSWTVPISERKYDLPERLSRLLASFPLSAKLHGCCQRPVGA